jgi:uncharacterized protein YlxW (UPF0749 family)
VTDDDPDRRPSPYRPLSPEFLTDLFRDPLDPGYAEAAARGPAASRGRWAGRGLAVATLVVVGLLLAVAYRQVVADEPARAQVRGDLEDQIHQREQETQTLEREADRLREEVAELRDQLLDDPRAVRELRELEAVTGLARVTGDGVMIRVDDGPASVDPQTGEQVTDADAQIKDTDLQLIANTLWAGGAEAVAINGRRLTATSTIRSASGAILIDRQPLSGPYEVTAIGPEDLRDWFDASTAAQLMRALGEQYGVAYELRTVDNLTLPAAPEPQLRYATTAGGVSEVTE